ncbi:hypothetical protein SAMN04488128_103389 [Chitinophaga eiseniae]|uniref:DNA-binding beta-propeller fold protein YncE n=1 Tax=Chitinophaga eiseniae TaxID=634771 RepID=A0A1T4SSZ4_9BACT|nr:DUF5074 domain-containing protein [Chitinophaga eiseniae]SKA30998.1 hypothetical protein SAMN04488128_103389 [Chitinophaga eiseniae]
MIKQLRFAGAAAMLITIAVTGCRTGNDIVQPVVTPVDTPVDHRSYKGFYLLNEGNMGSNKATLDFFDFAAGVYRKNIYAEANPNVVKELGDVGNDVQVYGNKLYAVINVSNKVEVMDATTTKRIKQIELTNCRYITFANGKAYISSYAGPVIIDPRAPVGIVAEVDTATMQITRKVEVGYQPEEMAVVGNKLYVANSGGYLPPTYDSTVSVIDLATFKETKKIHVDINLHRLKADGDGDLYVTSRGDYYSRPSALYVVDTKTDAVKKRFPVAASNICISGDTCYLYGSEYSYISGTWKINYGMINVKTETALPGGFITDGTEKNIKMPYGIMVDPETKDIYVTDARDYVSPGILYCFDKSGKKKWSVVTGDIPAHFAFVPVKK